MVTRKTPAKTTAGKTAAKSTPGPRKQPVKRNAPEGAKVAAKSTEAATSRRRVARKAPAAPMSAEERYRAIAHAAYLRAEKRGFAPGHEFEDWLAAEAEVDAANSPAAT